MQRRSIQLSMPRLDPHARQVGRRMLVLLLVPAKILLAALPRPRSSPVQAAPVVVPGASLALPTALLPAKNGESAEAYREGT